MDGPNTVRLQRRRNELPPDQLYVERRPGGKRKHDPSTNDAAPGYYVRQRRDISGRSSRPSSSAGNNTSSTGDVASTQPAASILEQRRIFHLKHSSSPLAPSGQSTKTRKRKQNDEFATVVEKKQKKVEADNAATSFHQTDEDETPSAPPKRPGRGSALKPRTNKTDPVKAENENIVARQQRELAALAQEMHQFALDELAKTPKPQIKTKPKLTPARSRALHENHVPASPSRSAAPTNDADEDTAMDSDNEYVYDTYVLAPAPTTSDVQNPVETHKTLAIPSNVGYLIITEDDEQLWETYIHDLENSDSEPTDEDDENGMFYSLPSLHRIPPSNTPQSPQPRPLNTTRLTPHPSRGLLRRRLPLRRTRQRRRVRSRRRGIRLPRSSRLERRTV